MRDGYWKETTELMNNRQMKNLCSKFSELILMISIPCIIHLHNRLHSTGPKLPVIPSSLRSDDSDTPPPLETFTTNSP